MGEAVKDTAIPDKQTEESIENEIIREGASGAASENFGTMD